MEKMIETNCFLFDAKLHELGVKTEDTPVKYSFSPSSVEGYRESLNDEGVPEADVVMVYFKSGCSIMIQMSYDELKQKINERNTAAWQG